MQFQIPKFKNQIVTNNKETTQRGRGAAVMFTAMASGAVFIEPYLSTTHALFVHGNIIEAPHYGCSKIHTLAG